MPDLDLSKDARERIMKMQPKHARQVLLKLIDLSADPLPHDSAELRGNNAYRRVDCGEHRIIYKVDANIVRIHTVGPRNDDQVYKDFNRKQK